MIDIIHRFHIFHIGQRQLERRADQPIIRQQHAGDGAAAGGGDGQRVLAGRQIEHRPGHHARCSRAALRPEHAVGGIRFHGKRHTALAVDGDAGAVNGPVNLISAQSRKRRAAPVTVNLPPAAGKLICPAPACDSALPNACELQWSQSLTATMYDWLPSAVRVSTG